ncbi:MAG: periplasmic heavy metal sensor [Betaproteobacteria bacterium]|nr:periplasmic heavy metal sensor [Betaproteobacteria bacterium]
MKPHGLRTGVLALGLLTAGAALAQGSMGGYGQGPGMMGPGMMHGMTGSMPMNGPSEALGRERPLLSLALQNRAELGLSEEQTKTLRELVEGFGQESDRRLRDIENAERELAGLLKQQPEDPAPAEAKVRAVEKLRADLRLARLRTIAGGRSLLTPEQRSKLDQLAARSSPSAQHHGMRGMEEMHRFMSSERMPQAMASMMTMAERMGGGDPMLGMVRMMEMMSMMGGGMIGGDGMMRDPQRPEAPR